MKYIEIKAPAKINIGLSVLSKRADGYHNLSTLFYPITDLYDILTFQPADQFNFSCSDKSLPLDSGNLVVKAKELLEKKMDKRISARIELKKKIPSQAGLGGGSSDAAATLISLNEMFRLGLKHEDLLGIALELGSDVPFFLRALPALGSSRGEILELVDLTITEPVLIVNPGINISTKEAFRKIIPADVKADYSPLIKEGRLDFNFMRRNIRNDFEKYVFELFPEIGEIKDMLNHAGALFSLMSGSGSTVYGIFEDVESAKKAEMEFPKNYFCFLSTPHH